MELYKMECTFSYFGTEKDTLKWLDKENVIFEISESLGEEDEHHSGIFTESFGVDDGETLKDVVRDYLYHNEKITDAECFSVFNSNGKLILTETEMEEE